MIQHPFSRRQRLLRFVAIIVLMWSATLLDTVAQDGPPPLPPLPGWALNAWRFDDTNWLSARGDAPRGFFGIQSVGDWSTNALEIVGTSALLSYNESETNGVTNIVCDNGTIMLW